MRFIVLFLLLSCVSISADEPTQNVAPAKIEPQKLETFQSFTGKVTANKVRIRQKPNIESPIIQQLQKNDFLLVTGEDGNFWKVVAPSSVKSYIFRSYVIDHVVEANRVNIRLQPNLESPIIGQLQSGDKIEDSPVAQDTKWIEIKIPKQISFYVAKEFISYAGKEDLFTSLQKRKEDAKNILETAYNIAQTQSKKSIQDMTPQEATALFDTIIKEYPDFPEYVAQAKEGLSFLQDNFLQKKIAYLESKQEKTPSEKEALEEALAASAKKAPEGSETALIDYATNPRTPILQDPNLWGKRHSKNEKLEAIHFWSNIEESLFATWNSFHPEKSKNDFYQEQTANAQSLQGTLEPYDHAVKNKPGNYVLKNGNVPIAYLYSTKINLEEWLGKEVTLSVSPRPNNNFAFPSYFVNSVVK
ncbi:MAG: SH3 domain-containing protein [Chlamydiota bacterium]